MTIHEQEKRAAANIAAYERSRKRDLSDCYGSYSIFKARAFQRCKSVCAALNGWNMKIISHNTNIFTCGFQFCDPQDGNIKFYYITPSYEIAVDM